MNIATDTALREALTYCELIEREVRRCDTSLDNVAVYALEIKQRIRRALKDDDLPPPLTAREAIAVETVTVREGYRPRHMDAVRDAQREVF